MEPNDLELALFRTAAYFAYFHYPLTSFEMWKWLLEPARPYSFAEVFEALTNSPWLADRLLMKNGFYALEDVEADIKNRRTRLADALTKYAKLKWVTRIMGRVPYVEGIAICNSLALHHTLPKSDIDLFIVAEPGRIWSARLFATVPLMLLRERPGERAQHPVCLSFFVTRETLAFETLKISERDPYLAYWCESLIPLVDRVGWRRAFTEENGWLKSVLPHAYPVKRARAFRSQTKRRLPSFSMSEKLAEKLQEERFPKAIRDLKNRDTRVVITSGMLKFHEHDRREEIKNALALRMQTLV